MASSERGSGVDSSERETLTCPFCSGSVATLTLLTCGHQLCGDCEQLFGNRNTFSCPLCPADMNLRSPHEMTTSSVEGMVPVLGDPPEQACNAKAKRIRKEESYLCQRCPSHERQNAARGCIECAEYLCETCSQDHQNSTVSKEHRLLAIEDYESEKLKPSTKKYPSYCTKHNDKVVDVFCQDCRKCVCLRCALTEHPNPTHRYVSPEDAAKEVRERFKPSLQEIDSKRKLTSRVKTTHAKTQRELKKNLKGGLKIIDQHANAIIENVREAQKKAKEEYQNAFSEKEKILSSSQKQIASLDSRLADTIKSVEMKVNFASDTQLLMSEDAITKDMHQLLQAKVDLEPQVTSALYFNVTGSPDVAEFGHIQTVGVSSDTMPAEDSNTMPSATLSVHETLIDNPEGVVSRSVFLDFGNPGQSSFEVTQRETPGNADQTSSVKQAMQSTIDQPGNDSETAGQRSTKMPKKRRLKKSVETEQIPNEAAMQMFFQSWLQQQSNGTQTASATVTAGQVDGQCSVNEEASNSGGKSTELGKQTTSTPKKRGKRKASVTVTAGQADERDSRTEESAEKSAKSVKKKRVSKERLEKPVATEHFANFASMIQMWQDFVQQQTTSTPKKKGKSKASATVTACQADEQDSINKESANCGGKSTGLVKHATCTPKKKGKRRAENTAKGGKADEQNCKIEESANSGETTTSNHQNTVPQVQQVDTQPGAVKEERRESNTTSNHQNTVPQVQHVDTRPVAVEEERRESNGTNHQNTVPRAQQVDTLPVAVKEEPRERNVSGSAASSSTENAMPSHSGRPFHKKE